MWRSVRSIRSFAITLVLGGAALIAHADSTADREAFRRLYLQRFPTVEIDQFVLGVYAIDAKLREQYESINEFPPYEFALDEGEDLVLKRFANGVGLRECLAKNDNRGVNQYPYFDAATGEIVSLSVAINRCRERNGEAPLNYRRQALAKTLAALNFSARGTRRSVTVGHDAKAQAAYESGKAHFYMKRGQLNLSCADCHVTAAGKHLREQTLAPLLGAVNHYPVYGLRWGALGTLHMRFVGCFEQVRAMPAAPQSRLYRELEYFLAVMSNGLPMSGPGIQR